MTQKIKVNNNTDVEIKEDTHGEKKITVSQRIIKEEEGVTRLSVKRVNLTEEEFFKMVESISENGEGK
jgi:hypothetical protein